MKRILLSLATLFLINNVNSQTQANLSWAKKLAGSSANVTDMITDNSGNLFVAGSFTGIADFDMNATIATYTAIESTDGFIAKYNSFGDLQWIKQIGGTGNDNVTKLAMSWDKSTVLATGDFEYVCNFDVTGTNTLNLTTYNNPQFGTDAFIAGYQASTGNNQFYKKIGAGAGTENGKCIVAVTNTEFFVGVEFREELKYDQASPTSTILPTNFLTDHFFVGRYSIIDGTYTGYNYFLNGADYNVVTDMVTAPGNNGAFILGSFRGSIDFDPSATTNTKTSNGGNDIFVLNLSTFCTLGWVTSFGTNNANDTPTDINYIDGLVFTPNDFYITVAGSFSGNMSVGSGTNATTYTSNGTYDGFVAKFHPNTGNFIKLHQFGGTGGAMQYESISKVEYDGGGMNKDGMVVYGTIAGQFDADLTSGTRMLTTNSSGNNVDLFFANYNVVTDSLIFAYTFGNNDNNFEYTTAMTVTNFGVSATTFYLGGAFYDSNVDFDLNSGTSFLNEPSNYASFVAKYTRCQLPGTPVNAFNQTSQTINVCVGTNTTISAFGVNFENIQWQDAGNNIIANTPGTYTITGTYSNNLAIETTNLSAATYTFYAYANSCEKSMIPAAFYVNVSACTDIAEQSDNYNLSVFPNPAKNQLHLKSTKELNTITITDIIGKTVYTSKTSEKELIVDVATLNAGVYFIKVNNSITKFIKE